MSRRAWLDNARQESGYTSVDPAPPLPTPPAIAALRSRLLDTELPMFQRMRAVFSLRNEGGAEAVDALGAAFGDASALLRHEIAYVMGQMGDAHALQYLVPVLQDIEEHVMVRHEAAEAMGAIGDESIRDELVRFQGDPNPEVSESCDVALDLLDWVNRDDLEYA